MSEPEFFVTPGYGERLLSRFGFSQAVKIGNRLELSGQGGWNDDWAFPEAIADEIAQAFRNVERTLAVAGASWQHVVSVHSYHVGLDSEINRVMAERFRHHMPDHAPIWTCLGVAALAHPRMRVEIRVTAVLPE
ncbi:MAG TPA: RidA family protein [Mycobacterium sp.]|nr:RidA family protein [Mycobacterium sp.]